MTDSSFSFPVRATSPNYRAESPRLVLVPDLMALKAIVDPGNQDFENTFGLLAEWIDLIHAPRLGIKRWCGLQIAAPSTTYATLAENNLFCAMLTEWSLRYRARLTVEFACKYTQTMSFSSQTSVLEAHILFAPRDFFDLWSNDPSQSNRCPGDGDARSPWGDFLLSIDGVQINHLPDTPEPLIDWFLQGHVVIKTDAANPEAKQAFAEVIVIGTDGGEPKIERSCLRRVIDSDLV